jgi:translation initiation factor 4E
MSATFDVNAKPFEVKKPQARPQSNARPQQSRPQGRPQQSRPQQSRPQQSRPEYQVKTVEKVENTEVSAQETVQQQSEVLPFVVSTALINVGNQGKTLEAARPTMKPFDMETQLKELAKETNLTRTLRQRWTMWLSTKTQVEKKDSVSAYMAELEEAATFSTIPQFCELWNKAYLEGNPPYSKIVVFKKGIKPVWEDPDNIKGGRFVIRASTLEETLAIFLVITVRLMTARLQGDYNDLCGAVLHAKASDQLWIQVWNKDASDHDQISRFKRYLNKLTNRTVAYQAHPDPAKKFNKTAQPQPTEATTQTQTETPAVPQEVVEDLVRSFLETH